MSRTTKLTVHKKFCKGDLVVLQANGYVRPIIKPVVLWGRGGDKRLTIQYLTLYRMSKELQKIRDKGDWYSITHPFYVYGDIVHRRHGEKRGKSIIWGQKMVKYDPSLLIDTWKEAYYKFLDVTELNSNRKVLFESSRQ